MHGLWNGDILCCDRCEYLRDVLWVSGQLQLAVRECDCHCLHL